MADLTKTKKDYEPDMVYLKSISTGIMVIVDKAYLIDHAFTWNKKEYVEVADNRVPGWMNNKK